MAVQEKVYTDLTEKKHGVGVRQLQMASMCGVQVALFFARSNMAVAVLAMTDRGRSADLEIYPWNKDTQGIILSSFFWGYAVMQIPGGLLAKRLGGKRTLMFALVANGLICLALPTLVGWGGWPVLCGARVAMGLTQAVLFPSCHTLLGRWLPAHERTTYAGVVYGVGQLGLIIGMPVAGFLAESAMGWKLIFYTTAAVLFAYSAVWWALAASCPAEHRMISQEELAYIEKGLTKLGEKNDLATPWRAILSSRHVWAVTAAHTMGAISYTVFFVDLPTFLEKAWRFSLKSSASLSGLPYLGATVGSIASTVLCDRLVNRGLLHRTAARKLFCTLAMSGVAVSFFALTLIGSEQRALGMCVIVFSLTIFGVINCSYMVNHLDLSPNFGGVLLSLTNFTATLGSIGTPLLTSKILQNDPSNIGRWNVVFWVVGSLCAAGNVIFVLLGSGDKQPWDDPNYRKNAKQIDLYADIETPTKEEKIKE